MAANIKLNPVLITGKRALAAAAAMRNRPPARPDGTAAAREGL